MRRRRRQATRLLVAVPDRQPPQAAAEAPDLGAQLVKALGEAVNKAPMLLLGLAWAAVLYIYWSLTFLFAPRLYVRTLLQRPEHLRLTVPAATTAAGVGLLALALGRLGSDVLPQALKGEFPTGLTPIIVLAALAGAVWSVAAHACLVGWRSLTDQASWTATAVPVLGGVSAFLQWLAGFTICTQRCSASSNLSLAVAAGGFTWAATCMLVGLWQSYGDRAGRVLGASVACLAIVLGAMMLNPGIPNEGTGPVTAPPDFTLLLPRTRASHALVLAEQMRAAETPLSSSAAEWAELLTSLKAEDPVARFAATYALGHSRSAEAFEPLRARLEDEAEALPVRYAAAQATAELLRADVPPPPTVLAALSALALRQPAELQCACLAALGYSGGGPAAWRTVWVAAHTDKVVVRRTAVFALGLLNEGNPEEAGVELRKIAADRGEDRAVREAARDALRRLRARADAARATP